MSRPEWLLNITNDAWFGNSAGPHQHFAAARLRAVEYGLPVIRVANTGISAIIDPYGRTIKALGTGHTGIIDYALPGPLEPTFFSRFYSGITWGLILLVIIFSTILPKVGRHNPRT